MKKISFVGSKILKAGMGAREIVLLVGALCLVCTQLDFIPGTMYSLLNLDRKDP